MKLRSKVAVVSLVVEFTLLGISHAQELKRIRIGYPSLSFRQSNVWVAKEQGLFKKYGLEVEPIFLRGGQLATLALAAGDPPIVNIGTVVQANLTGYNLVLVAAVENNYDQILFARPGITKLEQLKGKHFGISGFGAATHYATIILMKHLNFEPKDLTLLPTGPDAERIAAMAAGKIDATLFTSSAAAPARKAGFVELLQIADLGVEVQGNGFATSRAYVQSNRDVVKNALRGFVEAIYYIYANKKEAQRVFAKYMRTNDQEILEESYQGYIKMIPKKPYPTLKGIQFMLDMLAEKMPQAKTAKPEQFVDLSFLQELEKEGFFNEMAKRYPTK
ncbi:MAG: ABC transporter substrate-binding protein [Deltaproteobacteria bacterium]|nr:ABC transporter substrate-binding protein [Deltaproteobacteria bacterium]MBI2182806.1 ABC transporter substrate-binding protein [Deltaproteobacteria bacterium]MBI2231914.1 ABC transporter substrate-binding protein [Deltaproteobacteria bacterium]MBI2531220.1 ABC transporter substrate-binding protein [Deltaproteobacteria bacterium]MBI3066608.1 ABC transporter substrate-binding protein [Deltaproteobacteria bacterium]